jgi:hypothetical protein
MKSLRLWVVVVCGTIAFGFLCSANAAEESRDAGWQPLFNGKNLDGFYIQLGSGKKKNEDPDHLVQVHDGMIHMYKDAQEGSKQPAGYVSTEKEYSDYHLRFQYKWGEKRFGGRVNAKRDAGIIYHVFGPDAVWPSGVECQVQEGDVGDIFTVNTRLRTTVDAESTNIVAVILTNATGAIITNKVVRPQFLEAKDGGIPFTQGVSNSIRRVVRSQMLEQDGWNTVEVIVRGADAVHIVNGKVNNRANAMQRFVNGEWVPLTSGRIIFQLEFGEVLYRNIEIKPLRKESPGPGGKAGQ